MIALESTQTSGGSVGRFLVLSCTLGPRHRLVFSFFVNNKITIRGIWSWLELRLIKALRIPRGTNGIRRPVWGNGNLCFARRLWAASGCPKKPLDAGQQARCGLETSRRRRRHNERKYYESLTGQVGQMTSEVGISRARPGRRRERLESHRSARASPRDLDTSRAGLGAVGPARIHPRELAPPASHRALRLVPGRIFYHMKISRNGKT